MKDDSAPSNATLWSRRDLLTRSGWGLLGATAVFGAGGAVRMLFPRVRYQPPTLVVVGRPEDFAVGEVSERWKRSHRLILVRDEGGFYALDSTCTHLGCVPSWRAAQQSFKCGCHGSGFRLDGTQFEGPAPRALERLRIALDEEGRLVVDTAVRYRRERGEWQRPDAYAGYPAARSNDGSA